MKPGLAATLRLAKKSPPDVLPPLAVALVLLFLLAGGAAHRSLAQPVPITATPSGPKFEVASIRPARSPQEVMQAGLTPHVGITVDAARVDIGDWSLLQLIVRAYRIEPYQLTGPGWIGSTRFDIQATLPQDSGRKQLPEMLQSLLAERFGLIVHSEPKELPGFALRVASGGPKMQIAPPESNTSTDSIAADDENTLDLLWGAGKPFGLSRVNTSASGVIHMEFRKLPMSALAEIVSSYLRAPVVDQTNLEGRYQVTLDFSPTLGPDGNDLFGAVKPLGLKLERNPLKSKMLVVDHVERLPTAN